MRIAVLPFNAAAQTRPAVARQFANFASEMARNSSPGTDVDAVNYMARMEEDGIPRFALVNPSEALNDPAMLKEFFGQTGVDVVVDGLLDESEAGGKLTYRFFEKDSPEEPVKTEEHTYLKGGELGILRNLINDLTARAGGKIAEEAAEDEGLFGTTNSEAFVSFLQGFDASQYIERAQGAVIPQFNPEEAFNHLVHAAELDLDWEAPSLVLIQLARLCVAYRIGNADIIEKALKSLTEKIPDDARSWFALGDLYSQVNRHAEAGEAFEQAHKHNPEEPAILTRLAVAQLNQGMPVNAERNLRRAIELEGDEKPSLDVLANVLMQTGREHEVPTLWKEQVEAHPNNAQLRAKYAVSLVNAGRKEEGAKVFEDSLEAVDQPLLIKRYYAPLLVQNEDLDRAMDFYEDCIDESPTDIPLLMEYAQTLAKAKREFEIPHVLKTVLGANPDPNTRAQVLAWLLTLEQPKRVEAVQSAKERAAKGDFDGALREVKPLRNWLADYWEMWLIMASSNNQLGNHAEAEDNARRLLELFPACEPGYAELNNALAGQGKNDEAYALMKVALGNLPNSLTVAISYGLAAKRAGQTEEARNLAKQIREATGNPEELQSILRDLES